MLQHVVADRVHQVRLAEPHSAVNEQRVVRARRRFGDRPARGVGELIRRSDDEGVERVARVQPGRRCRHGRRQGRPNGTRPIAGSGLGARDARATAAAADWRLGLWRSARDEIDERFSAADFVERFGDDARIVLGNPVLEQRIRHADGHGLAVVGDERRGLEPRIEAMAVHFGLNAREDFFPDIAGDHG